MFVAEFNKRAADLGSVTAVRSYKDLQKKLKPGDILITTPRDKVKGGVLTRKVHKAFRELSKKLQGPYTHSAVYVGKGDIVEARIGTGTRRYPLRDALKHLDAVVVRPQVPAPAKKKAVTALNDMAERKAKYDPLALLYLVRARAVKTKGDKLKDRITAGKVVCSNLITSAYDGVRFRDDLDPELLMPVDLLRSSKTKPVAKFVNPGRRTKRR